MNRKTTVAMLLFIVMGLAAYLVLRQPPKGQRTAADRPRPLPALDAKAIKRVTIAEPEKPAVVLERTGETWALSKPLSYRADERAVRELVDKLAQLELGDLVTEQKSSHAEHQVDERGGVRVTVSDGQKTLADFVIGQVLASYTMLRPAGKDEVYQAVGSLRGVFAKEVKLWRDRSILSFKADDARALRVTTQAGEIALSRADANTPWKVDSASRAVEPLDASVPRALLSSLANFLAADFADGTTPAQAGLDSPAATIVAQLADKSERRLLVGKPQQDGYWVKSGDAPQVFLVKRYAAESVLLRPVDFRVKTVLSFKATDLQQIAITHVKDGNRTTARLRRTGEAWHKDGKPLADQSQAQGAAEALAALSADRFAVHSAAELGMGQPEWLVELRLADGARHELSVGSKAQDGFFGLQRKGTADLFACRKYKLDKFLLDPAKL